MAAVRLRRGLARLADLRAVRAPRNRRERARRVPWPQDAASSPSGDRVAIVVVSYQTRELMSHLLFSLYRILGGDQFASLVVVENASTDGSRELLEAVDDAGLAHVIFNRRQRYHGPGLNQAISWLARRQATASPGERIDHVLVVDSDVIFLRRETVGDAVATLRESGAALAGQKVPGVASEMVPVACLLLDPGRAWTDELPPFFDDGSPSQALQEAVLERGLGIAGFDFALGSYVLHLGAGTLARVLADEDVSNRFYGWARATHEPTYSRHPLGRHLHEAFLELYAREVDGDSPDALVAACRRPSLLTIPAAQPLPPVEELAALSAQGVDLAEHLLAAVRIRPAELGRDGDAILAVQRAGYAAEARLVGAGSLPGEHETIDDLHREEIWVAEVAGRVVGVVGIEGADEVVIARLVVDPGRARQGIGRALARHALALAGDRPVRVGTAAANAPALALYASLGFERVGERTVGDGLAYVELSRPAAS